jgi:hypothetical protein
MAKMDYPTIAKAVEDAIKVRAEEIKDELIKNAVIQFEAEIRKSVGQVSLKLFTLYSIERSGQELLIRVKIENG